MKTHLSESLNFTKTQRRILILILIVYSILLIYNSKNKLVEDIITESITLDSLMVSVEVKKIHRDPINKFLNRDKLVKSVESIESKQKPIISRFNPNSADSLSLINLGLNPFAVRNIIKYRNSGGIFKSCNDLLKIYGLDSLIYNKIKTICHCESRANIEYAPKVHLSVDLNGADSIELMLLKGIGPVLSKRIIKYRDRLGGFYKIDQLTEVYGIEDEDIKAYRNHLRIETPIRKMDLNKLSYNELIRHFYFDKHMTKAIINYVKQHGPIDSVQEIRNIKILGDSTYLKIENYLTT